METIYLWIGFVALIICLLAVDLGILNRKLHVPGIRESIGWTALWIAISLMFNVAIYFLYQHHLFDIGRGTTPDLDISGWHAAQLFFTGYIIEKALSLDNIFVIGMVFSFFGVPRIYQHRVLFWGIFGALVMRGAMILFGVALIQMFDWILYVFGILLLYTAIKMFLHKDSEEIHPENNILLKWTRKILPMTDVFHEQHFFIRENGRLLFTPLVLVLLLVESNDVIFAIDSIPAIFAITQEPFIIFTSNVFAILGLRSLYFVIAAMIAKFKYLQVSLSIILAYVGAKLLCIDLIHDAGLEETMTLVSLGVIVVVMSVGILASVGANKTSSKK